MDQVLTAFYNNRKKTVNNTRTDGKSIFLFDNEIIKRKINEDTHLTDYIISTCGWNTVTTQERLNCFLRSEYDFYVHVRRHNGSSYLIIRIDDNSENDFKKEMTEPINISELYVEVRNVDVIG